MTTKHMISPGIGFTPYSVRYIVTRGLEPLQLTDTRGRAEYLYYVDPRDLVDYADKRLFGRYMDPRAYAYYADGREFVAFLDRREYAKL